jgi:probable F420-dependent oxidoreductase
VRIGFGVPVSGSWATRDAIIEVAREAERLGYASLWTFQRTIYPADHSIGVPYRSVHDPIAVAALLAGVTDRIRIGLGIVNLPFYAPIVLAKSLTSIDVLSDGRLDAGLGLGWNPDEFAAAGVGMARRGARGEEFIACLRAIWSGDPVEFHGEFYDVPRGYVDPKPVQRPHPPILLGGSAQPALRRAGRLAAGWISASRFPADQVPAAVETVRGAARDAGRDPDAVRVIIRAVVRVRDHDGDDPLTGRLETVKRELDHYRDRGATEVFVDLNFDETIGDPDADPARSLARAREALEAFAPGPAGLR